jgi:flagellar FliL protein
MAKEEEKKEAAPAPSADASSGGGGAGKLGVILTIVNLLLTLGIGAVVFIQFKKDKNSEHVADIAAHEEGGHGDGGHGEAPKEGGHGEPAKAEGGHGGGHGEAGPAKPKNTVMTFEMFTVNLSTAVGANPKYIRVVVSVDTGSEDALNELNSKIPQARNAIIDLFNSKRPSDLQTGEGRNFVKEEIRNALNSFLVSGKIKAVYFSNYSVT